MIAAPDLMTEVVDAAFSPEDFAMLTRLVLEAWRSGVDGDWSDLLERSGRARLHRW